MSLAEYYKKRNFNSTPEPKNKEKLTKNSKNSLKNNKKLTKNNKNTTNSTKNNKNLLENSKKSKKINRKLVENDKNSVKFNKISTKIKNSKTKTKNNENLKIKTSFSKHKPIFVIQHHFARREHYDFRLEHNGVLLSWAVPKGLSTNPADKRLAVQVEDHPLDYAKFEGEIPAGNYGAGTVEIFDHGNFSPAYPLDFGIKKGHIKIILNGKKFKGEFSLVKIDDKNWLIIKGEDEFATNAQKNLEILPFDKCDVQLATLTQKIPSGKNWLFEIKYDGYRILAFKQNGKISCFTRNKMNFTQKMGAIAESLKKIKAESFVLDGELVAFDSNGKSDFSLLHSALKTSQNLAFVAFDLLALNGEDLRPLPLISRKQKLKNLIKKTSNNLLFSEHILGKGKQCFNFAKRNNLEGIVAKKIDSAYTGKRSEDWLKIKCRAQQEFVVCGYTTTDENPNLSALILGYYNKNQLTFVGKVGSGFSLTERKNLSQKFKKYATKTAPFNIKTNQKIIWLKPHFVAQIQYAELTADNLLRQPSFLGLREDKPAKQVKLEFAK